jgi:hypothetical protein
MLAALLYLWVGQLCHVLASLAAWPDATHLADARLAALLNLYHSAADDERRVGRHRRLV